MHRLVTDTLALLGRLKLDLVTFYNIIYSESLFWIIIYPSRPIIL